MSLLSRLANIVAPDFYEELEEIEVQCINVMGPMFMPDEDRHHALTVVVVWCARELWAQKKSRERDQ